MSQQVTRSKVLQIWGLALLAVAGMARAAEIPVSPRVEPVTEAPPVTVTDGAVLLSVDDAVEIALRRNLGLIVQRYTREQTDQAVLANLGIYDLTLNGLASASSSKGLSLSSLNGSESETQTLNAGFSQLVPLGGLISVGFNNSRSKDNSSNQSFNPGYSSGLNFNFDQPLLRNFGTFSTERDLLVAQNNNLQSRSEFERQVITTIQQVINAYWNLVGGRQQLIVAQESLGLAKELHERNRIQVDVGTMAPLELVQSEAAIASNEEQIIRAQQAVGDAEDVLRQLLNLPAGPLWQAEIRPTTDPVMDRVQINLDEAIQAALDSRPEIQRQELAIAQADIESRYARAQLKPQLDLHLGYNATGTGGDQVVRDPETGAVLEVIPGGYGDAFRQVTGLDFTGWNARLTFSVPLQNRAARAQSASADIILSRERVALEELRQLTITEVRQAARRVDTAAKSIDAARVSREFQLKNLDAQKKKYENGMSTNFEITRIQQDVTQARSNEVAAVVNYRTALAEYYRVVGQLLSTQGVAIEDPAQPISRRIFGFWR
jgi:outer membrane protein TolC